ncbi:MAG: Ppx/GppA phosphatase family protein [Hyphomicrobium aestuarii]|nr:Ppx/GppA phosphatase family protein [Hyphomicrobium aestuarii]
MKLFGERKPPQPPEGDRGLASGHGTARDAASGACEGYGLEPIGVIDIGSNSVRLVIYEGAVRSPATLFNEKVLCGLGRSVATTGKLGDEAVGRALVALKRFRAILTVRRVKNVRVLATAAVRDADDGADFIRRAQVSCGTRIEILTGEQEALFAAQGIMMGFPGADGIAGDLGGGSLELINIVDGQLRDAISLPLGGLRLIDTTGDRLERALPLIEAELDRVPFLVHGKGRPFYAVGGSWRSIARVQMEETAYPLRVMHGYTLSVTEIVDFARKSKKPGSLSSADELAKPRRDILPYGALILERLTRRLQPSSVVISVFGIREGLLFSQLSDHERAKDPLISYADGYARQRSRSAEHAHELCRWTDQLFTGDDLAETQDERRLRHAACLMSDVGWRAHPDYRGAQSLNVLAHASLGGIDHPGRVFLALAVYYRHQGPHDKDRISDALKALASKRALKRARIVGAAIRAAHMLSIGVSGVIDETPIRLDTGKLVLTLPPAYVSLDGERLRRRFEQLAVLLERTFELETGS